MSLVALATCETRGCKAEGGCEATGGCDTEGGCDAEGGRESEGSCKTAVSTGPSGAEDAGTD